MGDSFIVSFSWVSSYLTIMLNAGILAIMLVVPTQMSIEHNMLYYSGFMAHLMYIVPFLMLSLYQLIMIERKLPIEYERSVRLVVCSSWIFVISYLVASGGLYYLMKPLGKLEPPSSLERAVYHAHMGSAILVGITAAACEAAAMIYIAVWIIRRAVYSSLVRPSAKGMYQKN